MSRAAYGPDWPRARRQALERDGWRCVYCQDTNEVQVHHIRPLRRGGTNAQWNLISLCRDCHQDAHADIRTHGLSIVPGPAYEAHRNELTDQVDVLRYAQYLDAIGLSGDTLRALEGCQPA